MKSGKRRYSVTLTPERVDAFQDAAKALGLPPGTMSASIDDFLKDMTAVLVKAKVRGKFGLNDIFITIGEQIEKLQEEEKRDAEKRKEEEPKRSGN